MTSQLINQINDFFINKFHSTPILINSPGRINLIGEHTDYNEGYVFPAAIDKGITAAIQKSDSNFSSAIAFDLNESYEFIIDEIKPIKNGGWKNYIIGVVAEIEATGKKVAPFNIVFGGDIPNGAGLSSSAAIENSVVLGLNELFNLGLTKKEMIFISQKAEHNYVGVMCGIMDQYASMFGLKNTALLLDCRSLEVTSFAIDFKKYQLLLINTNVKHSLSESAYNDRRSVCENAAKLLNKKSLREVSLEDLTKLKSQLSNDDYQKVKYVIEENNRVLNASKAIQDNDIHALGQLLYESHNGLQHQYKVSCDELDFLVDLSKVTKEIIGSRMMGGGFGGCTINLIEKEAVASFSTKVKKDYVKQFHNECSIYSVSLSEGTHIVDKSTIKK